MEWLQDDKDGQWDCAFCAEKKLKIVRNCHGAAGQRPIVAKVFEQQFFSCPVRAIDPDAAEVAMTILSCEGGGLGGSRVLPSVVLEEPAYYFNVRSIVLSEQHRIQKLRDAKERNRE